MQNIGVVILNFGGDPQAKELLEEVLTWSTILPRVYYVVIGEKSEQIDDDRVEVIHSTVNFGFGGNNNLGIKASLRHGHDWTLLCNNDAKIGETDIATMLGKAEDLGDDTLFSLAPMMKEQNELGSRMYAGGKDISQFLNTREEFSSKHEGKDVHDVFYNIGSIVFLNNVHLGQVGLLDEDYFFSGEVADLCYRASLQGLRNICITDVVAFHFPENHHRRKTLYKYYSLRNRFVFIRKHDLPSRRMWKFYRFIIKDLIYQTLCFNRSQMKTDWICLWDSIRGVTGNQNHKFQ